MPGFPDWQKITQWLGDPIETQTGFTIGTGSHTFGPFTIVSWEALILVANVSAGSCTFTVRATRSSGASGLNVDQSVSIASGAVSVSTFALYGDTVSLITDGNTIGQTITFDLLPSNTISQSSVISGTTGLNTGIIVPFAGATAPSGFVLCDGSLYDGTTSAFADLWAVIGTTYGGTAQSSFAVPDLRGRSIVGLGSNAAVNALGKNDGVAEANRRGTTHYHLIGRSIAVTAAGTVHAVVQPYPGGGDNVSTSPAVATDPRDGGAYLVLNYIIAL